MNRYFFSLKFVIRYILCHTTIQIIMALLKFQRDTLKVLKMLFQELAKNIDVTVVFRDGRIGH